MADLIYRDRNGNELPARELEPDALLGHRNPRLAGDEKHLEVTLPDGRVVTRLSVPAGEGLGAYAEKRLKAPEPEHRKEA